MLHQHGRVLRPRALFITMAGEEDHQTHAEAMAGQDQAGGFTKNQNGVGRTDAPDNHNHNMDVCHLWGSFKAQFEMSTTTLS